MKPGSDCIRRSRAFGAKSPQYEGPPVANDLDGGREELSRFLEPVNPKELDEALDVTPVAALRAVVLALGSLRLEHRGDGPVEALALADDGSLQLRLSTLVNAMQGGAGIRSVIRY